MLDLFSGIGGFAEGFKRAGYKIKEHYFSEKDKHAIANYHYNFKNAKYVGPIESINRNELPRPNIITFGSPCQDFSLAGKRKGLEGERSSLIQYAIDIIAEKRPDIFIWENVKGAFSSNNSEDFTAIIQAFANIGGYRLEWQLLNTSWVLPQNRERIYLIGHLAKSSRSFRSVFPITENDRVLNREEKTNERQSQAKVCKANTINTKEGMRADSTFVESPKKSATLTAGANSGGLHSDMTVIKTITRGKHQQDRVYDTDGIMCCLPSTRTEDKIKIISNTNKGYEEAKIGDSINTSNINSKTRRGRVGKQKSQTLDCACAQAVITPNRKEKRQNGRRFKENGEPAFTLNTQDQQGVLLGNTSIRRLTEIECERLQGFPDNWTKYGIYNGETKEIAKTNRYKLIGNAVTVDIVELIAKKLKQ